MELAIWSLICAVLVLPPAGIVMGAIARRNMRASNNFDGGNIAWAGIIIGAIYTAFDAFLIYQTDQRLADWIIGAVEGCVPLYIVLQIWFGYAWSGRWRIAALAPEIAPVRDFAANTFDWVMGCTLVYCAMFGIGEFVLQAWLTGLLLFACAAVAGYLIYWSLGRRGWQTLSGNVEKSVPASAAEVGLQETD